MRYDAASVATFTDLAASPNGYRAKAFEELSKHYERRERNYAMALEMIRSARRHGGSDQSRRREDRLLARAARGQAQ